MTALKSWYKDEQIENMMRGKPVWKIVFLVLGAVAVLCVAWLGLFFLISNLSRINLRNSIISECPFSIAEDAEWKMYSNNNQAGLIAQVSEHNGQANRMILVIDKSAAQYSSASVIRSAVLHHDYFRISYSEWEDNWKSMEEKDVYETGNFIYLRVQYDSRSTLTRIKIGYGAADSIDSSNGEGVLFTFSEQLKITYYNYYGTTISMSQKYDEKKSAWSEVTTYEGERVAYD